MLRRPIARAARLLLPLLVLGAGCEPSAGRRGDTVLFASGADLQSINPLVTLHPLARQVQRYVLLTTLVRYDSALAPYPYLARRWEWSADQRRLTLHLATDVRWHDGAPTTARDAAWTLDAARDPATGYPRATDLATLDSTTASDDSTLTLAFSTPPATFPDVLTDLAILPAHLLDSVPHAHLREAAWNAAPVGNGPFRFVGHEPNRRWVFTANPDFPASLGGPPGLDRFIVVVVDEPTTKLAALTSGELDFAGIQPAHARFVARDPRLAVVTYPLLLTYGIVFNTRRAPFDDRDARRAVIAAIDRREIVEGYLFGFGIPASGPVPPGLPGYLPLAGDGGGVPHPPGRRRVRAAHRRQRRGGAGADGAGPACRAGFDVVIRQLELSAFLDRVYGPAHDFDAAVMGIPGDLGLGYLGPLAALAGSVPPAIPRPPQRLFADSVPVAFLYHARGLQGMNRRVQGVRMDLRGELPTVHDWTVAR